MFVLTVSSMWQKPTNNKKSHIVNNLLTDWRKIRWITLKSRRVTNGHGHTLIHRHMCIATTKDIHWIAAFENFSLFQRVQMIKSISFRHDELWKQSIKLLYVYLVKGCHYSIRLPNLLACFHVKITKPSSKMITLMVFFSLSQNRF